MSLIEKVIGPKSKYDRSIPYTYMAKVYVIENDEELCRYYFGDTICSLVTHLNDNDFTPSEVKLFGVYQGEEIELDKHACTDKNGHWLLRPELCRSLESYYENTKENIYKGHVEIGECLYEDRDQRII